MGDWDYINEKMGGFDEDGLPNFLNESGHTDENEEHYFYNSKPRYGDSSAYKEVCNYHVDYFSNEIIRIYIDLTPEYFLDEKQKEMRNSLLKQTSKITLDLIVNKNNTHDSKVLEVYYKNTFIGYIRKNYKKGHGTISSKSDIENYCFYENKLDDVTLEYLDGKFILSKPISLISDRVIEKIAIDLGQDEKHLINIWKWAIENQVDSIPLEKDKLLNLTYIQCNKQIPLEKDIFQLTNLTAISLEGMGLASLPSEIGNLTKLDTIYLSNNHLSELPDSISKLKNLKEIYLDDNQFNKFPEILLSLSQLKTLKLDNNNLLTLPDRIVEMSSLEELDLGHNDLSTIPSSIGKLIKLQRLVLWHNNLVRLPNEIGNLVNLKEIFLNHNKLTKLPHTLINVKASPYIQSNAGRLEWPGNESAGYEKWLFVLGLIFLSLLLGGR